MVYPMTRFDWTLDPFRELQRLQRDMNRLLAGFISPTEEFPALNLWTSPEEAILAAEIPGVDPKDVTVSVTGDVVTIEGERKDDSSVPAESYHRREREMGKFMRSIRLPYEVEADKVQARYENGILRVVLPRKETTKPRRIAIEAA
ncbi:MAG: Hsp20/alpha crystallin family protein [Kiritimatiellae bacterium]|nr:Hsp20/alpha crystallin family protein [Kiritimatiellia bacterium]MDW8458852.1 Hsp20/alpha crystallin family protein [Verrucomicrobiota bacterium]